MLTLRQQRPLHLYFEGRCPKTMLMNVLARVFCLALGCSVAAFVAPHARATDIFRQGFENGLENWTVDGGLWQVGPPKVLNGPKAFAGANVAGTGLTGNYGATYDTRLITPEFTVPA